MFCLPVMLCAQVEESAEITTEVVEDVFQQNFFEALKQKGIGNYDKALNHLGKCKELDGNEPAVDYEMGRIYTESRQYLAAEDHLLTALKAVPSNIWYLDAAVTLYLQQEDMEKAIALAREYRDQGWEQQLALAGLHIKNNEPDLAREIINGISTGDQPEAEAAVHRLQLSLEREEKPAPEKEAEINIVTEEGGSNEATPGRYREELESLLQKEAYDELLLKSTEAASNFPAQPEFYYYRGMGMLKTGDAEQALAVAEEGLAYLLDNDELELAFYSLMKDAYNALGNEEKAKEFENKIKNKQ